MRQVHVISGRHLRPEHRAVWAALQAGNPHLDSAFYAPELTQLVSRVRDDVEVAILSDGGEPVGFFPYQRSRGGRARPVAGRLTEFHGPICRPDLTWDLADVIRRCRLRSWYFDHLPAVHSHYIAHSWSTTQSPYADLRGGFDQYEAALRERGGTIAQVRRKERKLAREVGPIRFDFHTLDDTVFEAVLEWKADQYEKAGRLQIFTYPWIVQLLDSVRKLESDRFAGVMSALYAGDQLAAVHLGIRTPRVLHIWFPTYSRELEQYSPGLILLTHLAQQAAGRGVTRIDFGPGEERYKQQFKSGDTSLLVGGVDLRLGAASVRRTWHSINQWVRRSRYREYLEVPINATRRYRQWLAFR